ncbi:ABC transporter ATP-binding protein [Agromyces sp. NPDC058126]|uniref:ABC transporter ATP-binding protein n=1 Tax=Agromyces sp. NPDC058126 TaxID=3346350 RepID=UPI0036DD7F99
MRIQLNDVGHQFARDSTWLFRDVNCSFEAGTITALMGPSGSGKSTLLGIISGIVRPVEGSVTMPGPPDALEPRFRNFSWMLQVNSVLAGRTAVDNASLAAIANGYSHRDARRLALHALDSLGLADRAWSRVGELSGGEVQRVTVARALLSTGSVLLADEPTAQLDASNTQHVIDALRIAAADGRTVIVATHDESVAAACDRTIRLRSGQLQHSEAAA